MIRAKALVLILAALTLVGCAGSADGSDSRLKDNSAVLPSPEREPSSGCPIVEIEPIALCIEILKCAQQCASWYPYRTQRSIDREASAGGWLNSGAHIRATEDNNAMIEQHGLCLELPANEVINL